MLPIETINAVFPSSVPVGKTSIGPMTLLHAVALEALGVDVASRFTGTQGQAFLTAFVVSLRPEELDWCVEGNIGGDEIKNWLYANEIDGAAAMKAARDLFADAFSTYVKPKDEDGKIRFDDLPDGYGWPLEMAEMIAHEHGIGIDAAFRIPMARVFGIVAVMRQRYGGESSGDELGRDYYDRIRDARMKDRFRAMAVAQQAKSE